MASRSRALKCDDPVIIKMLAEKNLTYDDWVNDTLWATFRDAINNPRSPMRRQILEVAEQKIKDEFIKTTLKN